MYNRVTQINLDNITVRRGNNIVLENYSFSVPAAQRVILAGKNGTGKTTLLKTILGLIPTESGRVEVFGNQVGSRRWLRQRQKLGYVDQESIRAELPITAWEVVEIGVCRQPRQDRRTAIAYAMGLTGCAHLKDRLYASLSGGEKQKVSLARCLSQQAEILILDEPTSSLDQRSRRELMGLLERLNEQRGITILMASHDIELLSRKDWRIHPLGMPLRPQPLTFLHEEVREVFTVAAFGGKGQR